MQGYGVGSPVHPSSEITHCGECEMPKKENAESQLQYAGLPADWFPAGIYHLQCIRSKFNQNVGRLFVRFQVADDGPYKGMETFISYNIPRNRTISSACKYYSDWTWVNGRSPSKKGIVMTPKIFHNRIFRAKCGTRYLQNTRTKKPTQSDDCRYTIVEKLLEKMAEVDG